ncbi:MAG: hypothetical protein RLZZ54_1815 [Cyanobacteriota bacterium]|jgi:hypothetical protein
MMFHWPGSGLWFIRALCSLKAHASVLARLPVPLVLLSFRFELSLSPGLKRAE